MYTGLGHQRCIIFFLHFCVYRCILMTECEWHAGARVCVCSEVMLPSRDVRRELIAILATIATQVALKGVSEAVAAHVDGVHDVVQEKDAAVLTAVGPHLLPVRRHHLEPFRGHLHAGADGLVLPLLLLLDQRQHAVPHTRSDVVGQVDEARCRAAARPVLLVVALGVCGVVAAVARRAVLLTGCRLGEQQQVLGGAILGRQTRPAVALCRLLVKGEYGAEGHVAGGGRGSLHQRPQ